MSKFFEELRTTTISGYIDFEKQSAEYNKGQKIELARLLRNVIGDVKLPRKIIEILIRQYNISGGKYDVRTNPETLKGVYNIYSKFPNLSAKAIDELISRYIDDLFEEYSLVSILEDIINVNGQTDDSFEKFLEIVDKASTEHDKKFIEQAKLLDQYSDEYKEVNCSINYVEYLKTLVIREHIPVEKLIKSMADKDLIIKDADYLAKISRQSRIYMGVCLPSSYTMTRLAAKDELSSVEEQPTYHISTTGTDIPAPFTKSQFIESIKKQQQKIKK